MVLDPFLGSGTTAVVTRKLGRNFIGIELNPKYVEMARRRLAKMKKDIGSSQRTILAGHLQDVVYDIRSLESPFLDYLFKNGH